MFSPETQNYCRQLDYMMMKGCFEPLKIFTFDVTTDYLHLGEPLFSLHEDKKARVRQRLARDKYRQQIFSGEI